MADPERLSRGGWNPWRAREARAYNGGLGMVIKSVITRRVSSVSRLSWASLSAYAKCGRQARVKHIWTLSILSISTLKPGFQMTEDETCSSQYSTTHHRGGVINTYRPLMATFHVNNLGYRTAPLTFFIGVLYIRNKN